MYIYNDEDNAPMNDFDRIDLDGHNPTVYHSWAEMRAAERIPFDDATPDNGCWNCLNYDPSLGACTVNWNNGDDTYYNPDTDDRKPDDFCDTWDEDKGADWHDWRF